MVSRIPRYGAQDFQVLVISENTNLGTAAKRLCRENSSVESVATGRYGNCSG